VHHSLANRHREGFSLLELLIVVAIILVVAAIAIPNLLRARMAANESSAANSMHTIDAAEVTYESTYPASGFSSSLASLGPAAAGACTAPTAANACLIDYSLSSATSPAASKNGYYFGYAVGANSVSYTVGSAASKFNQTGVRSFCSIEDGVIRQDVPNSQATPTTVSSTCTGWPTIQ